MAGLALVLTSGEKSLRVLSTMKSLPKKKKKKSCMFLNISKGNQDKMWTLTGKQMEANNL